MTRTLILALLLAGYVSVFAKLAEVGSRTEFDPLSPRGRQVEMAIETKRFADALPVATDLARAYPRDPVIAYFLAEIYRGLNRPSDEARAWERFMTLSKDAAAEACPALPEAYARLGDQSEALRQYERCVELDPQEPERLIDLAAAQSQQGLTHEAVATYTRAAAIDSGDPRIAHRIAELISRK